MITFIIPAYKNVSQLKKCLKAIKVAQKKHKVAVFVHDNNKTNIGFTKAINLGLDVALKNKSSLSVVLNQDCYIKEDFIDKAIIFMRKHPQCMIAGVKQLLDRDQDFIMHAGCTTAFPNGRHIVGKVSKKDCEEDREMHWVNGACMVVNMVHVPRVGFMDENFFLLGSDSDWCYTARQRGFEVWYASDLVVRHEQGVSTKTGTDKVEYSKLLDMVYFRDKWIQDGVFMELSSEVLGNNGRRIK